MDWARKAVAVGLLAAGMAANLGAEAIRAQDATPAACVETTPSENKTLVQRYFDEVYNEQNPQAAERFLSEDFTRNNVSRPQQNAPGNADDVQRVIENLEDFPDLRITVEDVIAEDDMVAARLTWNGTQRDAIDQWNAPATGTTNLNG